MARGYVIPIGGAEEKFRDPAILKRFVDLCGGSAARIAIIPTASRLSLHLSHSSLPILIHRVSHNSISPATVSVLKERKS